MSPWNLLDDAQAREASVCVQQGRLHYEAADKSDQQVRPLLLYYGALAYSAAVIVARGGMRLHDLPRCHGPTDESAPGSTLQESAVEVTSQRGMFHVLHDTVRPYSRVSYLDAATDLVSLPPFLLARSASPPVGAATEIR